MRLFCPLALLAKRFDSSWSMSLSKLNKPCQSMKTVAELAHAMCVPGLKGLQLAPHRSPSHQY